MSKRSNTTTNKSICIVPAAGGAISDLAIAPGTTPQDVKAQLGLGPDIALTRGKGSEPIPDCENLYETTADGAKLYATTPVEWGFA